MRQIFRGALGLLMLGAVACDKPTEMQFALDPSADACARFVGQTCISVQLHGSATFSKIEVDIIGRDGQLLHAGDVTGGPVALPTTLAIRGFEDIGIHMADVRSIRLALFKGGIQTDVRGLLALPSADGDHVRTALDLQ